MEKKKIFIIIFSGLALLGLIVVLKVFVFGPSISANAALKIDSWPRSTVFLDDKEMGQTPFNQEKMTAGELKIKLVPIGNFNNITPWETKVKISNGVLTYVSREIGTTNEESAGYILTMEPLASNKSAEIAVVSDPDGASINLDGIDSGKTSAILKDVTSGDHTLVITSSNYADQTARIRVVAGYRINVILKLRKLFFQKEAPIIRPTSDLIATNSSQLIKPYVVINQTPTGFLRVRINPDPMASISGQVYPGEKYPLQEEINNWTRIKLATMSGWVSDQYIEKVK